MKNGHLGVPVQLHKFIAKIRKSFGPLRQLLGSSQQIWIFQQGKLRCRLLGGLTAMDMTWVTWDMMGV